jgi:hypothetical protein
VFVLHMIFKEDHHLATRALPRIAGLNASRSIPEIASASFAPD